MTQKLSFKYCVQSSSCVLGYTRRCTQQRLSDTSPENNTEIQFLEKNPKYLCEVKHLRNWRTFCRVWYHSINQIREENFNIQCNFSTGSKRKTDQHFYSQNLFLQEKTSFKQSIFFGSFLLGSSVNISYLFKEQSRVIPKTIIVNLMPFQRSSRKSLSLKNYTFGRLNCKKF